MNREGPGAASAGGPGPRPAVVVSPPTHDDLLVDFLPRVVRADFGSELSARFAKPAAKKGGPDGVYALEADVRLDGSSYGQHFGSRFFDCTFNFCLTHQGQLIASLGFEIDDGALVIWQLQGVKGCAKLLRPFRWERALVVHAISWARLQGFANVFMVSMGHNQWAQRAGHLDRERGRLRYDVTASRCGFKRGDDGYFWLGLTGEKRVTSAERDAATVDGGAGRSR